MCRILLAVLPPVDCESYCVHICALQFTDRGVWLCRYTQCEMMTTHYKQPVLLIEFEENKSFSLQVRPITPKSTLSTYLPPLSPVVPAHQHPGLPRYPPQPPQKRKIRAKRYDKRHRRLERPIQTRSPHPRVSQTTHYLVLVAVRDR